MRRPGDEGKFGERRLEKYIRKMGEREIAPGDEGKFWGGRLIKESSKVGQRKFIPVNGVKFGQLK